jgi:hypothetical protein
VFIFHVFISLYIYFLIYFSIYPRYLLSKLFIHFCSSLVGEAGCGRQADVGEEQEAPARDVQL